MNAKHVVAAKIGFWALLVTAYSVGAVGVMIDVLSDDYQGLSQVAVTSVHSPEESRTMSAAQLAAVYRARSGAPFSSLPPGSTFRVVWPDGSSEYVVVVNPAGTGGVQPIPGTQTPARTAPKTDGGPRPAPIGKQVNLQ